MTDKEFGEDTVEAGRPVAFTPSNIISAPDDKAWIFRVASVHMLAESTLPAAFLAMAELLEADDTGSDPRSGRNAQVLRRCAALLEGDLGERLDIALERGGFLLSPYEAAFAALPVSRLSQGQVASAVLAAMADSALRGRA